MPARPSRRAAGEEGGTGSGSRRFDATRGGRRRASRSLYGSGIRTFHVEGVLVRGHGALPLRRVRERRGPVAVGVLRARRGAGGKRARPAAGSGADGQGGVLHDDDTGAERSRPHRADGAAPSRRNAPVLGLQRAVHGTPVANWRGVVDRKSTRLNSSHGYISYAVFCLKKKKT